MTDAIILNLDETDLVLESVRRLRSEKFKGHVGKIIIVDNGSEDAERLTFLNDVELILVGSNKGASTARNLGLEKTTAQYVFLLDGDILYIPKSIPRMVELAKTLPEFGCLGVHNPHRLNGTQQRDEADITFPEDPGKPFSDFDMAWTQFGLFNGKMLREKRFFEEGVYGEAGNGYEDDWLWNEMHQDDYISYYLPKPLYYHEQHGGQRWLDKKGIENKNEERKALFVAKWGKTWYEKERHYEYTKTL